MSFSSLPRFRFAVDKVHAKMVARKPFLVVDTDIQLEKGKPVKILFKQGD